MSSKFHFLPASLDIGLLIVFTGSNQKAVQLPKQSIPKCNLGTRENLSHRQIAIVELPFNARRLVMPLVDKILAAVEAIQPNGYMAMKP